MKCIELIFIVKALVNDDMGVYELPTKKGGEIYLTKGDEDFQVCLAVFDRFADSDQDRIPFILDRNEIIIDYDHYLSCKESDSSKMYDIEDEKRLIEWLKKLKKTT